jgi:hypothetical protein
MVSVLLIISVFHSTVLPKDAAQSKCETELAEARNQFYNGFFNEAIALVEVCLKKSDLKKDEKQQAYELLAKIHVANDDTLQAKSAVQKLLELNRDYRPDPVKDSKQYRDLVEEIREELPIPLMENGKQVKYHVGGSYLICITSTDNYMPIGIRFLYHLNKYTIGVFLGKVIDYGEEYVEDTDGNSVGLIFDNMTFAEISFDYMLTKKKPISTFVGLSIAYSNPLRSEVIVQPVEPFESITREMKITKFGFHPQIGLYLQKNYPISARISGGYVFFPPEDKGVNHSGLTLEGALLLSF